MDVILLFGQYILDVILLFGQYILVKQQNDIHFI